jgi:hypothetical protein
MDEERGVEELGSEGVRNELTLMGVFPSMAVCGRGTPVA